MVYYYRTEWDKSIEQLLEGVAELTRLGDPWEYILGYIHLGYNWRQKSNFNEAEKCLKTAVLAATLVKDLRGMGQAFSGLGEVLLIKGEIDLAEKNILKAINYSKDASDHLVMAMALKDYAQVLIRKGEYEKAVEQAKFSREIIEKYAFRSNYTVPTYLVLADALLKLAQSKEREKYLREAWWPMTWGLILAKSFKNYMGYAYRVKGVYSCLCGNRKKGEKYFDKSIIILEQQGNKYELGRTLSEAGKFLGNNT